MSDEIPIEFKKLHPDAIIPTKGTEYSAGWDLYALEDTLIVGGAGNIIVPTGIAMQLPPGTYGRIAIRSGHAVKHHLTCSAGVVDLDYDKGAGVVTSCTKIFDLNNIRGYTFQMTEDEEGAPLLGFCTAGAAEKPSYVNNTLMFADGSKVYPVVAPYAYLIRKAERFAQIVVEKASYATAIEVTEFSNHPAKKSEHVGYGSTGK